jgi:phage gpG-like protein
MSDFEIIFSPDAGMFIYGLEEFADIFKSLRAPLKEAIQKVVAPSFRQNFDVGGRPAWEELTPQTVARGGSKPLVRTGLLQTVAGQLNIWTIDGIEGMAYVDDLPRAQYGEFHQEGTSRMPARPWAVFQDQDIEDINELFGDWVEAKWRRSLPT